MSSHGVERAVSTGEAFAFTADNLARAEKICARYPEERRLSAMLPALDLAQRQHGGWLSLEALDYVAEFLRVPAIRVYEVATFYSMFNVQPVGKYFVQVCRTTPCWLRGSDAITHACKSHLGIELGDTTDDRLFTVVEVECLGACVNAPMVQINDDYYEDLTPESMRGLLDDIRAGKTPPCGSQTGRRSSEAAE
ncbi:MAG: NADH-quinone oxidoreductase subunit NuoE [Rickettsiales bacterium]